MAPAIVHLPNGQNLTVTPVFGGLFFKSNDLSNHHSPFPPGWTVVLNSEESHDLDPDTPPATNNGSDTPPLDAAAEALKNAAKKHVVHRFKKPTLHNDHLFISSISSPSSADFKPPSSPTRQVAMMLWATLWWYFHQQEPDNRLTTPASITTAPDGRPRGEWRININREGIFKGRVVLPKLERMGLVASEDSSVGLDSDERSGQGWRHMFVSRRSFWQLDPRIYLFTLSPMSQSPYPSGSPYSSRPASPSGQSDPNRRSTGGSPDIPSELSQGLWSPTAPGQFHSTSHLPTYYPPPPPQYTFTNNIRHPIRSKPPRQGETFYTRYIPSVGQYLSFRVACASNRAIIHRGPVASASAQPSPISFRSPRTSLADSIITTISDLQLQKDPPCDTDLLHKWMNDPRVAYFWGESGSRAHIQSFLEKGLASKHSFPVIGCWDGKPFGYFEVYWVKEDNLGKYLGGECGYFDRGIHCLVGEQEFRGGHRVRCWLSALVHYCWLADNRTETVVLEPRVDNEKLHDYLMDVGFHKNREISFPHKQSNLMVIHRESWEAPCL